MVKHRRIPPTRYPRNLEDAYRRRIVKLVYQWRRAALAYFTRYMKRDFNGGIQLMGDAPAPNNPDIIDFQRILANLNLMGYSIQQATSDQTIRDLARMFVRSIDTFSYKQVKMQTAIVGLNPVRRDQDLQKFMQASVDENAHLIKAMQNRYADQLTTDVYQSVTKGGGIKDIMSDLTKQTGMSVRHARMVANDQTGSIYGQMNIHRYKKCGVEKYVWQTQEDNRVRPAHQELDQTVQNMNDPDRGDGGEDPGEPINCRCVALGVFDDLL